MRIASPSLGPILLIELRVLLAGLVLVGYAALTGKVPRLQGRWRTYLLNASTPLFGAVASAIWMGETLTLRQVVGLLMGLVGVATLVGLGPVPLVGRTAQTRSGSADRSWPLSPSS